MRVVQLIAITPHVAASASTFYFFPANLYMICKRFAGAPFASGWDHLEYLLKARLEDWSQVWVS